jgi:transcriptional regulator with XRE-family HTH domain
MPQPKGNPIATLHVGSMLKQIQQQKRVTHAVLARRMGRDQSSIRKMMNGETLQTYILWEISVALRHNFFADLARQLDAATEGRLDSEQTELQQLRADYERLKEERDYLRKAIDMLHPKT